jgi:hypothetical protein
MNDKPRTARERRQAERIAELEATLRRIHVWTAGALTIPTADRAAILRTIYTETDDTLQGVTRK